MTATAPLELIMVEFTGNRFHGDIVPALADLVEQGIIEVVDGLFVTKDADSTVTIIELESSDDDGGLGDLVGAPNGLVGEEDVLTLAGGLAPESSAAILLFEHAWARELASTIRAADGELRLSMRIPGAIVDEVRQARQEAGAR